MEHDRAKELFSDYWEQTLGESDKAELNAHLSGCVSCTAEYRAFEQAMVPLGQLRQHKIPAPPNLFQTVPSLIRRRSRGRFFAPFGRGLLITQILPFLMLMILAIAYLILKLTSQTK